MPLVILEEWVVEVRLVEVMRRKSVRCREFLYHNCQRYNLEQRVYCAKVLGRKCSTVKLNGEDRGKCGW